MILNIFLLISFIFAKKDETILHLIPHSHVDTGWYLTQQQYFDSYVKTILEQVTEMLTIDPTQRFTW